MRDDFSEKRIQKEFDFDPQNSAILVVDMVNEFLEEGGKMVLDTGRALYGPLSQLLNAAHAADVPVFWLNQWLKEEDKLFETRVPHCIEGTWGAEIVEALPRSENDIVIPKRRYSGFFQTDLDLYLRERNIKHVVVTGVVTNICVRSTVNDAFFLGYNVLVPADGVGATSDEHQEAHLYDIDTHYGTVVTVDDLVPLIEKVTA